MIQENLVKFSITIPAYKAKFLKKCIDSILCQTYDNFEVIVLNDASPEPIDEIIAGYDDQRIFYYKNDNNVGAEKVVDNWNKCLDYATGDYIICMGDDDMLMPDCLQEYYSWIRDYPEIDVFHCRSYIINDEGEKVSLTPSWAKHESVWDNIWHRVYDYRDHFIGDYLYKRIALVENGKFYYLPMAWASDDITSYIVMREKGVMHIDSPLFCYRRNDMTISNTGNVEIKLKAIEGEELWYEHFMVTYMPEKGIDRVLFDSIQNELPHYFKIKRLKTVAYFGYGKGLLRSFFHWLKRQREIKLSKAEVVYATILAAKDKMAHKK